MTHLNTQWIDTVRLQNGLENRQMWHRAWIRSSCMVLALKSLALNHFPLTKKATLYYTVENVKKTVYYKNKLIILYTIL